MRKRIASKEIKDKIKRLVEVQVELSNSVCNLCGGHNGHKLIPHHVCKDGRWGNLISLEFIDLKNSYESGYCNWIETWKEETVFQAIKEREEYFEKVRLEREDKIKKGLLKENEIEIHIERRTFKASPKPLNYTFTQVSR